MKYGRQRVLFQKRYPAPVVERIDFIYLGHRCLKLIIALRGCRCQSSTTKDSPPGNIREPLPAHHKCQLTSSEMPERLRSPSEQTPTFWANYCKNGVLAAEGRLIPTVLMILGAPSAWPIKVVPFDLGTMSQTRTGRLRRGTIWRQRIRRAGGKSHGP